MYSPLINFASRKNRREDHSKGALIPQPDVPIDVKDSSSSSPGVDTDVCF